MSPSGHHAKNRSDYHSLEMGVTAVVAVRDLSPASKIISLMWDKCLRDLSLDVEVYDAWLTPVALLKTVAKVLNQANVEPTIR